jgi:hypothetical protein
MEGHCWARKSGLRVRVVVSFQTNSIAHRDIDKGVPDYASLHPGYEPGRGYSRPRYALTPGSGAHTSSGSLPACQNTSIGMPPRGWK